ALLNQVVGDAATKDREWPQQFGAAGRCAGAEASSGRQDAEERIRQRAGVVTRIRDRDILVGQARRVNVIAEGDVVFVVAGERNLQQDVVPQLLLDAEGILVSVRHPVTGCRTLTSIPSASSSNCGTTSCWRFRSPATTKTTSHSAMTLTSRAWPTRISRSRIRVTTTARCRIRSSAFCRPLLASAPAQRPAAPTC